jgi:hypothetical protein
MDHDVFFSGLETLVACFPQISPKRDQVEVWRKMLKQIPGNVFLSAVERVCGLEVLPKGVNVAALIKNYAREVYRPETFEFSAEENRFRDHYRQKLAAGEGILTVEQREKIMRNRGR